MHFNADDASVKMMMDLISSANDICIAFGICDYLGKFSEIGVESRRNSASVVPYSKSRRTFSASDLGLLQLRMSEVVPPIAEGNLLLQPNQPTRMSVVERANDKTDEELYRLCQNCRLRRNLQHRGASTNVACTNSAGNAQHTLWRSWQTNQCWKWPITSQN